MSPRFGTALVIALLSVGVLATSATAGVPDPSRSTCTFPDGPALPCPDPVTVNVIVRDAFDATVANCSTSVSIVVASGSLEPGQLTVATGLTDASGSVDLVFPDGVFGNATVSLAVVTHCAGNIALCESPPYLVMCTGPTPVDPKTWGRVKASYR